MKQARCIWLLFVLLLWGCGGGSGQESVSEKAVDGGREASVVEPVGERPGEAIVPWEIVDESTVGPEDGGVADLGQEPVGLDRVGEEAPLDGGQEPGEERVADAGSREAVVGAENGGVAEVSSEPVVPEQPSQEAPPEVGPPLQAKAVSLLASFLGDDPQSGLMDRGAAGIWSLTLVVPKGDHTFSFRLDKQAQRYGVLNAAQFPVRGVLVGQNQGFKVTFARQGRATFKVELQRRTFAIELESLPTEVRLEGSWNGQSNQTQSLTRQSDGRYSAVIALKKGDLTWRFGWKAQQWTQLGVLYPAQGSFPQGGALVAGGKALFGRIPRDGDVEVVFDPLHHTYLLRPVLSDPYARYQKLLQDLQGASSAQQKNDLLTDFFVAVRARRELPIVKGNKVVFLLWWKMTAPVYAAGSFNAWSTTQNKMQQVSGTDFFHLEVTMPKADRYEYKFVDSASTPVWITDPYNPRFVFAQFGPNSAVNLAGSGKSHLERFEKFSATLLQNTRDVYVYVPAGYRGSTKRYPVLYMHDGQNLFDPKAIWGGWGVDSWADRLIASGKMQPVLIVGPANTPGRMEEYTHTQDRISSGGSLVGGKSKEYADFLVRDLKPFVDGSYRTLPGRRQTGTMGSSLGGLISLWLGENFSDVFFRIGALSSTFGWGTIGASNPTLLSLVKNSAFKNYVVYVDSGSPNDNYQVTLQMRDILQQKGYLPDLNMQHWTETGAVHNEQAWNKRLERPLTFLFGWP